MFGSLKRLLSELTDGEGQSARFDENDYRLAAAALLVHAAAIDGAISAAERTKLHDLIRTRFELDDATTEELLSEATAAEHEAVDLYRFTSLLNRKLNAQGRARIIEMMWEIVYADHRMTELEDNLLWRTADLLGVSRNERIALRERVKGE